MKKFSLILVMIALLLSACDSNKVKIRGKVAGLEGTVKLMAEMPGQEGMTVLAQQEVKDGSIDLQSETLQIPARVWVDVDGKQTLEFIVDSKDQIWIEGKIKFPDQIEVKGSGIGEKYDELKKLFKEKYDGPIEPINKKIEKILSKPQRNTDDAVRISVYEMQKQRYLKARLNYAKTLIEANPQMELSLFLLQDELKDSVDMQKRIFKTLKVENKESNIYKNLAEKLK